MYCVKCGRRFDEGHKFCPECGTPAVAPPSATPADPPTTPIVDSTGRRIDAETPKITEKMYFEGDGELVVKKVEHRGAGRKIASWLAGGPVGYLAFGRDKTRKAKAKGRLVVTQKALYCAGNEYKFDKILSLTRTGRITKSVLVDFEKDVAGQRYDIRLEIRTKDMDRLFAALEDARMSKVGF